MTINFTRVFTSIIKLEMWLIFGQNGWIGQKLGALLQAQGQPFVYAKSRLENREDIAR
jgi:hypothetical protein